MPTEYINLVETVYAPLYFCFLRGTWKGQLYMSDYLVAMIEGQIWVFFAKTL